MAKWGASYALILIFCFFSHLSVRAQCFYSVKELPVFSEATVLLLDSMQIDLKRYRRYLKLEKHQKSVALIVGMYGRFWRDSVSNRMQNAADKKMFRSAFEPTRLVDKKKKQVLLMYHSNGFVARRETVIRKGNRYLVRLEHYNIEGKFLFEKEDVRN